MRWCLAALFMIIGCPATQAIADTARHAPGLPLANHADIVITRLAHPRVAQQSAPSPQPDAAPSGAPVSRPATPDIVEIGRRLQSELRRVGCVAPGMENDGAWGAGSRDALRAFVTRTKTVAVIDQPTQEALELVQHAPDAVCSPKCGDELDCTPTCEPGAELRDGSCVEVRKKPDIRASRPPAERPQERERSPRAQRDHAQRGRRGDEPRRADDGPRPPTRAENQSLDPKKGESWFYLGRQRCKTYQPTGETPRIICP